MLAGERDLDIVLYGATGFVGTLVARYLARVGAGIRVGLAGRSLDRLQAVRDTIGGRARKWPLIIAELNQPAALREMAARTQVVLSAVGPYSRLGLPVVAACAAVGTDYADLTGEVPFVRESIDRYHQLAIDNRCRIVHSCGFDSLPSDLTAYALHRRAVDDGGGNLADTTLVLRAYSGGYAGGSISTMVELMRIAAEDPTMRRMLDDPYSLSPDRSAEPELGTQPDLPLCEGSAIAPELKGLWLGGYIMALYNTRCVRRSNALLGWAYGRRFRYSETITMGSSVVSPFIAAMFNMGIAGASRFGGEYLRLLPRGLVDRVTPAPGTGHDEGPRGYYKVETYTTTTTGQRYRATMSQQGDPGYRATAVMAGESALALVVDRDRLTDRFGVLTPVSAMGEVLLDRLPAAGVKLETAQLN
ncbi:saccharopine dehydrogenase family protein [Mycobacterium hubeiense]|uniref:saccharopine dehydrogenase family protein n=1 Tax=Mycobacterium hubeiense TaxID=1867256 RepID=UPI000C7F01A0|nr:saccharopine dehydrogenase NADP-binding domain-containing protein [Mycobacterium sp. QGD 101]